jgi:hypothetical protein
MSYKKYIEKDGKVYGPYVYKSHRVNGKIVSEYCGQGVNKKKVFIFAAGAFILIAMIFILIFYKGFTGNVVSEESAPIYPSLEKSVIYPVVYFTLLSIRVSETEIPEESPEIIIQPNNTSSSNITSYVPELNETEEPEIVPDNSSSAEIIPEEEIPVETTNKENEEVISPEIPEETEDTSTTEEPVAPSIEETEEPDLDIVSESLDNIANFFLGFLKSTGMAVSEEKIEIKVNGNVSLDEPFIYELSEGETIQLLSGSVKTDLFSLPDNAVKIVYKDNLVIISTNYSEYKELTEDTQENSTLIIEERKNLILTEPEKNTLLEYFGNSSVKTVKSELFKGRYVLGYELGEFNIEYSYDSELEKEILKAQIEKDKVKWLKDISAQITQEESVHEEVNLS